MLNNQVQNFVGQFLAKEQAGLRPSVSAPTAPNPFMDDSSRDIGFQKFLTGFTTAPNMATGVSSGIAIGGSDKPEFFSGNLRVGSVDNLVEDVFVSSPYTTNPFIAIGQAASKRNLQKIQENVMAGKEGYGLGIFQGRLVGVTPGGQLSGVLPGGMTREQQQELASNILASPQRRYKDEKINVTGGVLDYHPDTGGVGGSVYDSDVVQRETQSTQSAYEEASGVASADYSDRGVERGRTSDPRRFAEGGNTQKDPIQRTGFVEGPPQEYAKGTTVADTENMRVREGSFVINAPITEKLQKAGVLPKGNQKRKAANGGKMMEVALSKGEYVVEPKDVPKFGGYGFLEAVNDMGKPEVERRQAMQEGGFVTDFGKIRPEGDEYNERNISVAEMYAAKLFGVGDDVNRALAVAREYQKRSQTGDRAFDTLQHVLGAGYMYDQKTGLSGFIEKQAIESFDSREVGTSYPEESAIDLNNNKFGRALREKFPDKDEFTREAITAVDMLSRGETYKVGGLKPQMSIGYDR